MGLSLAACGEKADGDDTTTVDDTASVDDTAADEDSGDPADPVAHIEGALVVSAAVYDLPADLSLPFVAGVAFADPDADGALTVALFTWAEPGCDSGAWIRDGLHQDGGYGWVVAGLDSFDGAPAANVTWGNGASSGSGRLGAAGSLTLNPASAEGLVDGDLVEGQLAFTDADMGIDLGATFAVTYCGARFQ